MRISIDTIHPIARPTLAHFPPFSFILCYCSAVQILRISVYSIASLLNSFLFMLIIFCFVCFGFMTCVSHAECRSDKGERKLCTQLRRIWSNPWSNRERVLDGSMAPSALASPCKTSTRVFIDIILKFIFIIFTII